MLCVIVIPSLSCCVYVIDKMKDVMVAKVAMQASDLFADAANNMQVGQVKSLWEKVWHLGSCDLLLYVICRVGLM